MIGFLVIHPAWGHVAGVFIVLMMSTFIGIWIWAWHKQHKPTFNRMARLPLEDDRVPADESEESRR